MLRWTIALALAVVTTLGIASQAQEAPSTDRDKTLYALGQALATRVADFDLTPQEFEIVRRGLADGVTGKESQVDMQLFGPRIAELHQQRVQARALLERGRGETYRNDQAALEGAKVLDTGLIYFEKEAGQGPSPKPEDAVTIHYVGSLVDGKQVDRSPEDEPVTFELSSAMQCFRDGVGRMKMGGKARLVCPPEMAFGDRGNPPIPPGATLVFDVELVRVVAPSQPPAAAGGS